MSRMRTVSATPRLPILANRSRPPIVIVPNVSADTLSPELPRKRCSMAPYYTFTGAPGAGRGRLRKAERDRGRRVELVRVVLVGDLPAAVERIAPEAAVGARDVGGRPAQAGPQTDVRREVEFHAGAEIAGEPRVVRHVARRSRQQVGAKRVLRRADADEHVRTGLRVGLAEVVDEVPHVVVERELRDLQARAVGPFGVEP